MKKALAAIRKIDAFEIALYASTFTAGCVGCAIYLAVVFGL